MTDGLLELLGEPQGSFAGEGTNHEGELSVVQAGREYVFGYGDPAGRVLRRRSR